LLEACAQGMSAGGGLILCFGGTNCQHNWPIDMKFICTYLHLLIESHTERKE